MSLTIELYTKERMEDAIDFERRLRLEEEYGWEIDEHYRKAIEKSFDDPRFDGAISLLAYENGLVVGRIDATRLFSRFDGLADKAYLDWICVIKSYRHRGVAQALLRALSALLKKNGVVTLIALAASNTEARRFYSAIPNAEMKDEGVWIDL